MGVDDHGVAGGDHVDRVGGHGGHRVGHRGDDADDAPGGALVEAHAGVAAVGGRRKKLGAGDVGQEFELGDFVVEAADFGFFELEAAPGLGVVGGDLLKEIADGASRLHAGLDELLLCPFGGEDGGLDFGKQPITPGTPGGSNRHCRGGRGYRGSAASGGTASGGATSGGELAEDFRDDTFDELVVVHLRDLRSREAALAFRTWARAGRRRWLRRRRRRSPRRWACSCSRRRGGPSSLG